MNILEVLKNDFFSFMTRPKTYLYTKITLSSASFESTPHRHAFQIYNPHCYLIIQNHCGTDLPYKQPCNR